MLIALVVPVAQSGKHICYVRSDTCSLSSATPCYEWSNVTECFNDCIKVCKTLSFAPGSYFLNTTLLATNDKSISFIGDSANTTSIVCLDQLSLFAAVNISTLLIMNINWINCGGTFEDITIPRFNMTLLLYNVMSAKIFNVVFNSSHGYALLSVTLQHKLKLSLLDVSIFDEGSLSHSEGIMILNLPLNVSAVNVLYFQSCFVLISNCKFYNLHSGTNVLKGYNSNSSSVYHAATAIGLVVRQQLLFRISNTTFANIISNNKPVVLISYLINKPTIVTIVNSTFSYINCIESSLLDIKALVKSRYLSLVHVLSFQNCKFIKTTASQLIQMHHYTAVCVIAPIKIKILFLKNLLCDNTVTSAMWRVQSSRGVMNTSVLIANCSFLTNHIGNLRFEDVNFLTLKGRNTFDGNIAEVLIYLPYSVKFSLQGSTTFSNNRVNTLVYLSKYLILHANYSLLNITNNQIMKMSDLTHHSFYLVNIIPDVLCPDVCAFQISHCVENITSLNTSIIFQNNTGYQGMIYGYPLNNCKWDLYCNQNHDVPPSDISVDINHYDQTNNNGIIDRDNGICYCTFDLDYLNDSINCDKAKIDTSIYPGQTISLPLTNTAFNSSVSVTSYNENGTSVCKSLDHNICFPSPQLGIVYETCSNLTYAIKSDSTDWCMLCLKTVTQSQDNRVYSFNITLQECPPGLVHYNGVCICDPELNSAVKELICNFDNTLIRPQYSWISAVRVAHNVIEIAYTNECYLDYCSKSITTNFNVSDPDVQCSGNRAGIACGRCAEGLSAVFGTSRCKRCTNMWLLLIPVLAVAGVLLVWLLFALNLTVVDGHIYGYILYVNILSLYSSRIFPSNYLIYFPLLMSNLDLGIELCFYDGMTNYATTWLQFIFPVYVISLVIALSFASKYSQTVERLTRKRVIPVIATLYLLAYNKMMFMIAKGLFSYRTIHYLRSTKTETYWAIYTQIPLFGLEFGLLFTFCVLLFLLLLLPTLVLFLFPKTLLKYKLVTKYLKPFMDAYLAPFKETHYNTLGAELVARAMVYGCETLRADYTALACAVITLLYLGYLNIQQPFKSWFNTLTYTMYLCNLGCVAILFVCYPISKPNLYIIAFNCLTAMGFAVFVGILLLHFLKYCTCRSASLKLFQRFIKCRTLSCFFLTPHDDSHEMEALNYAQYREDLLALDPNN